MVKFQFSKVLLASNDDGGKCILGLLATFYVDLRGTRQMLQLTRLAELTRLVPKLF